MAQGAGCTPQRIFGTYEQTLFLGMTIQDFSATVGWDQQYTTLAVNLIQDDCSGYRWYYKVDSESDTPWTWVYEEFTEGDPGFNGADVGSPVLLKIGETRELDENGLPTDDIISKGFEFAGIIQSINIKNDSQGRNVYTINLISPGILLDGGGVILSDFAESLPYNPNTNDFVPNIFNVYGFLESIYDLETGEFRCPSFAGFGSPCGGYGNARLTDNGIPWFLAKQALQVLVGGRYNGGFGECVFARPPGTLVFKPGVNSYGSLPDGQYILDIDDIPIPEDPDTLNNYRVTGPIKTINELLSEVTSDAGCNYYVDMLPTFDAGNPTKITNVIKIRVVKRSPTDPGEPLNDINNFIASKEADAGVKVITSSSSGTEYIPEYTSAFIIGGSEKRLYRASTDGLEDQNTTPIVPFVAMIGSERTQAVRSLWGQTFFPGSYFDAQWYFDINWRDLNYIRPPVLPSIAVDDTIPESMLYAANYGVENWLRWVFQYGTAPDNAAIGRPAYAHGIYQYLTITLGVPTFGVINNLTLPDRDPLAPGEGTNDNQKLVDTWHTQIKAFWDQLGNNIKADVDTLYQYIAAHAQTLGHFWTVQVPFACRRNITDANDLFGTNPEDPFSNDTDIYEYSDLPSTDGGWLDTLSTSDLSIGQLGQANLIGLRHRLDTDAFSSENGLIGAILRWDSVFDDFDNGFVKASEAVYKNASQDLGTPGLWVRASIAPNWVNIPDQRRGSQDINLSALLQINSFVSTKFGDNSLAANFAVQRSFAGGLGGWNARKLYDINPGADVVSRVNFLNRRFDRSNYVRPALAPFALPRDAIIPILSNTKNYGPWHYNATFANSETDVKGKTLTVQDEGFVPWEYGGSKWMSKGAEYLAESSISDVDRGERGSVTIAGYPENQLGAEITKQPINLSDRTIQVRDYGGFEYNYIDIGGLSTATSQITNLSVSVGPGGITTQYQLSSFTPVFAAFNKLDQDRIKEIAQQNFKIQKSNRLFAKGSYNTIREAIREWMRVTGAGGDNPFLSDMLNAQAPSSMHVVMLGKYDEVQDNQFEHKSVDTSNVRDTITIGDKYDFSSMMSFDGFFRPIKTKKGTHPDSNTLPQDNQAGSAPAEQPKQSVDPYGPLNAGTTYVGPVINKDYLDFLANPTDSLITERDSTYSESSPTGHDIEVVARDTLDNIQTLNDGYLGIRDPNNLSQYKDGYRYLAHRGPLVVHGWGYDIMGKPVPNNKENNISGGGSESAGNLLNGGVFGTHQTNYSGLSDQFYGGWMQRPDTWPAGPVDLRWDRNRGVWTVPSDLRFYLVRLDDNLESVGSTATCNVRNAEDVFDTGGDIIPTPQVTVTMPYADAAISGGQDILVYWSHESGMYFPIQACCGGGGGEVDPTDPTDPPPCDQCDSRCEYECTAAGWVVRNDNCQSQPGCSCPGSLSCLPQDLCQPANYGLFTSCACINADCPQYLTFDSAINPATETGIDFYSDRQVPGVQGTVTVELIQDMPSTTGYTFGSGLTKIYDDQPYAGIISGTGVDYSAIICTPGQTGQDPYCAFDTTNPYIVVVSNANNFYNLPSGTTATIKFKYGTNVWEILEYKLPNQGCLEVSSDTTLNYYLKVFTDASAGDVVLTLPLATGEGVAGREYQIKKIDTSANSVIISGTGNDTIDGGDTYYLNNQYEAAKFVACGNDQWFVF